VAGDPAFKLALDPSQPQPDTTTMSGASGLPDSLKSMINSAVSNAAANVSNPTSTNSPVEEVKNKKKKH
jgi:hypothetical protein